MKAMLRFSPLALVLLAGLWAAGTVADAESGEKPQNQKQTGPALRSAGPLEFSPEGTLFFADPEGAAVYAFDVSQGPKGSGPGPIEPVDDLDETLAAMLGTSPRDLMIQDMAVHPKTGTAYLSILRGRGEGARPVLMTVSQSGEVAELPLETLPYSKLDLANPPDPDDRLYQWPSRGLTVTDMEFIEGELYVAGLSNEEFASTLRRAAYPFDGEVETTSLEIYHGAHGEWETFAPIFTFVPYEIGGKRHLLASYLCTPLVTFPLDEVKTKKKLRGKTVAELGWGNIPRDIIPYRYGDEDFVLLTNNNRGAMKIKAAEIVAAQAKPGITHETGTVEGVSYESSPLGAVVQAADLDADSILLLARNVDNGALTLRSRSKRGI